jgi:8-amino-7-oxononanoate synthase
MNARPTYSTLLETLEHRAATQPDLAVFTFLLDGEREGEVVTFAGVERRARAIAVELLDRCRPGDRAVMLFAPGLEFIAAFFGCLCAGVIAVPAYPPRPNQHSVARLLSIVADAEPALVLTTSDLKGQVEALSQAGLGALSCPVMATDTVLDGAAEVWRHPRVRPADVAFLQYTSGSTGQPKGVMVSHENLLQNLELIRRCFGAGWEREGCGVIWLPPYHDMGLIGGLLQPMYVGKPVVLMSPLAFIQKPLRWLEAVSRYRAVCSGGPSFAYELCVRKIPPGERARLDLSSWEVAFNGAEPVRAQVLDDFSATFAECGFRREAFYPCYGMAEATLLITGGECSAPPICAVSTASLERGRFAEAGPAENARRLVGCGRVWPGQDVRIVDPETRRLAERGAVGEIWVAGPGVARGYWNREAETAEAFHAYLADTGEGPFLRTGDLGAFFREELYITGRRKDLIIIRGRNHYPDDVERIVERSAPGFRAGFGAAFSVEVAGEERLVVVQEVDRRHAATFSAADAIQAVRKAIAEELDLQVFAVQLLQHGGMPKTSSGKLERRACRAGFLEDRLEALATFRADAEAPPPPPPPAVAAPPPQASLDSTRAVSDWLRDRVASLLGRAPAGVDLCAPFAEHGLDSLQAATLVGEVSEWSGCDLPAAILDECGDLAALAQHVAVLRDVTSRLAALPAASRRRLLGRLVEGGGAQALADGEEIPERWYRFERFPELASLLERRQLLDASGMRSPYFAVHEGPSTNRTRVGGRELINFSSNNYLAMCGDPAVLAATKRAVDAFGTGAAASRMVSGEKPLHLELERALADLVGAEESLTFVGGHLANSTTIGHLMGRRDLVVYDELSHDSLHQGVAIAGADALPFPHDDWRALDRILAARRRRYEKVLVFIEGIYSMDGDICDLPRFIEVKQRHRALLMVDECLSIGVLGEHGRGVGEHYGVDPAAVDVWMGGISKAFASCGGYIAGRRPLVEYLRYTAPGFVYTTGMSPANAAAALASVRLLRAEPERVARLHRLASLFREGSKARGLDTGRSRDTPVIPIIIKEPLRCLQLHHRLFERGINVQPIFYPAVPANASRLRFFVTASHTEDEIRAAVDVVAEECARLSG